MRRFHLLHVIAMGSLLFLPRPSDAAGRYVELVNASHNSVVSLALADPGGAEPQPLRLRQRLPGGGGATTLEIDGGACIRDLHVGFRDGSRRIYTAFDTCRRSGLRLAVNERPGVVTQIPPGAAALSPAQPPAR